VSWPRFDDFTPAYATLQGVRARLLTDLGLQHSTLPQFLGEALQTVGATLALPGTGYEQRGALASEIVVVAALLEEAAQVVQFEHATTPPWDTIAEEMRSFSDMAFRSAVLEFEQLGAGLILPSLVVKIGQVLVDSEQPHPEHVDQLGHDLELAAREHFRNVHLRLAGCVGHALLFVLVIAGGADELAASIPLPPNS
jgi:hypothetical protein